MQTNFNVRPPKGYPGQLMDVGNKDVFSFVASTAIGFGVLCEIVLVSGVEKIRPVQDTGTTTTFLPTLAGVSVYDPMREQGYQTPGLGAGYKVGEMVPVVRRGRVRVAFDGGGTWPTWGPVRVQHSSDASHAQGVFTMTAAQTTVGNEIDLVPGNVIGVEVPETQASYTDAFGNAITTAVVSLNLL